MSGRHARAAEQPEDTGIARAYLTDEHLVKKVNDPDEWLDPLRDESWGGQDTEVVDRLVYEFLNRRIVPRLKKIRTSLRGRKADNE